MLTRKKEPSRKRGSFALRAQKSVSDFEDVFDFGAKTAVGVQGASPCEMHFWVVYPPKSAIEYSTYEQHIKSGTAKTTPNYTATKNGCGRTREVFQ